MKKTKTSPAKKYRVFADLTVEQCVCAYKALVRAEVEKIKCAEKKRKQ